MGRTTIEWTATVLPDGTVEPGNTINPLRASLGAGNGHYCEKVSPGCKNCYSSRLQPRFRMPQFQEQRRLGVGHYLDRRKLVQVLKRRKPTKWFWCDMTDMFGEWVPIEHIALCFATMAATPWHTHQVLTKRPERMRDMVRQLYADDGALLVAAAEELAAEISACHIGQDDWKFPLGNVWLGTSTEDQVRLEQRLPPLLQTPAVIRFLSCEPLLEPLILGFDQPAPASWGPLLGHLHWVIVGSESGQSARPFDLLWAESIVQQCRKAKVACFVKQMGTGKKYGATRWTKLGFPKLNEPFDTSVADALSVLLASGGKDMAAFPEHLRVRDFPEVAGG